MSLGKKLSEAKPKDYLSRPGRCYSLRIQGQGLTSLLKIIESDRDRPSSCDFILVILIYRAYLVPFPR